MGIGQTASGPKLRLRIELRWANRGEEFEYGFRTPSFDSSYTAVMRQRQGCRSILLELT